ncbi:MAG: restriction endonuclease subunit S, partial [Neisseriaceae bacterium]|nr:restriction endonuclease subunit S [Neisseriaceae bacterium]
MNNKVFFVNRREIEGRLDSEYYRPDIAKLEKVIRQKSTKKLADFAYFMASGGTPNVSEENYYSDEKNGIPFLRVQNLTEQGVLDLNGLKYISKDVHQNMLKHSQFDDQDLLVKITGVGRMAVASVSPIGFVGNTNQHMIVVKTKNRKISEYLASYLNLNIVEKLAKRRSTGGTRPALDYSALRSIPIIENIDFSKWENAKIQAQSIQKQSQTLLNSISDYLL